MSAPTEINWFTPRRIALLGFVLLTLLGVYFLVIQRRVAAL